MNKVGVLNLEEQVASCVDEMNLEQLVTFISEGKLSSIGVRSGHFEKEPDFQFKFEHFDVSDGELVNPRIQDGYLMMDLWFHFHSFKYAKNALQERTRVHSEGIQKDVLLTVIITHIDFVSTDVERYYWDNETEENK